MDGIVWLRGIGDTEYTLIWFNTWLNQRREIEDDITLGYGKLQFYVQQWGVLGFEDERIEYENKGEHNAKERRPLG